MQKLYPQFPASKDTGSELHVGSNLVLRVLTQFSLRGVYD
jgi:hypothetical protein